MRTRSQKETKKKEIEKKEGGVEKEKKEEEKKDIYEVVIDFDGASAAWRANKKSAGNGCYKYVCESITKTGKNCTKVHIVGSTFCNIHFKKNCSIPKI
jgi:hypothetical protein